MLRLYERFVDYPLATILHIASSRYKLGDILFLSTFIFLCSKGDRDLLDLLGALFSSSFILVNGC